MQQRSDTILVVSQQQLLKAGNQVLFQAVQGYLRAGYRVALLTLEDDDPNVANTGELFGEFRDRIQVVRFAPPLARLAGFMRRFGWLFREERPEGEGAYPPAPESVVPFSKSGGIRPLLMLASLAAFSLKAYRFGCRIFEERRVALVCGFEVFGAPAAALLARQFGVPCLTKYQGTFLFQYLNGSRLESEAWIDLPAYALGTAVPADLVVMENDGTRGDAVLKALGAGPGRIRFWIAGVRKDMYEPGCDREGLLARYGVPPDARIVLTLSKLNRWKRLDRAVGAMAEVLKRVPNAYLFVLHRGPERENLERLASRLGISDRVVFTGPVPHPEVRHFLNVCDIFLSVNDHSNLSNTILEALECGRPIVTIDDGSTSALLADGKNALLVARERISAELPQALIALLEDEGRRLEMSRRSRAYAERCLLSWEERMRLETDEIVALIG